MTVTFDVLERSKQAVLPALRAAVDRLDDETRTIAAYHLGWSDVDGNPTGGSGGKSLRSGLATLSAQAAGAPQETAVPGAVAVELVHNFSLVHDDLMDGDTERRHRPTVWAVWGAARAILVGDALLALAQSVLLEEGTPGSVRAARLLADTTGALIRGQVADIAFETRTDVRPEECLAMSAGKTGALISASAAIGAMLAGAAEPLIGALSRYGEHAGLAFQLVDDLLGIWGDPDITGKPVFSDLRSRKKSLPVCYAAFQPGPAGRELAAWLARDGTPGEAELVRAAELVDAAGGRDWASAETRRRIERAEAELAAVSMPTRAREELVEVLYFIGDRSA